MASRVAIVLQDLRFAMRALRKSPGLSAAIIAILALGIGANTAIFSLVDCVLFRPLPLDDSDRLVRVFASDKDGGEISNSSYPVYRDYRDGVAAFSGLAAYADSVPVHVAVESGPPQRVTGAVVTGNYFDVLGIRPALGRFFGPHEDRDPGAHPVVVLGDRFWKTACGGDEGVVGRTIRINRREFTVLGTAPAGFFGASLNGLPDVWIPMAMIGDAAPEWGADATDRGMSWLDIVGRLKPGISPRQAQEQMNVLAASRQRHQPPGRQDPFARVLPARDAVLEEDQSPLAAKLAWILAGIVLLVLAITCADTAGLLLARGERRRREIAIRTALGATRSRLVRQLLFEALLLSAAGAAAGLLLASSLVSVVVSLAPVDFPIPLGAARSVVDSRVLIFTTAAALAAGVLFGLAPAWRSTRRDVLADLKGQPTLFGGNRLPLRDAFSAAQIALCCLLLVGAGLLLRTLRAEQALPPGFDPDGALVFSVDFARQGYPKETQGPALEKLLEAFRNAPGVRAVAAARSVPIDSSGMRVTVAGQASEPQTAVDLNIVTPGFFATLGTPVLRGREFSPADRSSTRPVAVVNRALAEHLWPGQDPVGRTLRKVGPMSGTVEIVGVVETARYRSVRESARPMISVPVSQWPRAALSVVVRTSGEPLPVMPALRSAAAGVDPGLPLFGVRTLRDRLRRSLGLERLLAFLLGAFGALALVLAGSGLYGVVSSSAQARRREFGIRMALGAGRGHVLRLVFRRALTVVALGLVVGIPGALLAAKALSSLLFGVASTDPSTIAAAATVLAAVALVAGAVPARRAAITDPCESLRRE